MFNLMFWRRVWAKVRYGWGPEVPEWAQGLTAALGMIVIVLLILVTLKMLLLGLSEGGSE